MGWIQLAVKHLALARRTLGGDKILSKSPAASVSASPPASNSASPAASPRFAGATGDDTADADADADADASAQANVDAKTEKDASEANAMVPATAAMQMPHDIVKAIRQGNKKMSPKSELQRAEKKEPGKAMRTIDAPIKAVEAMKAPMRAVKAPMKAIKAAAMKVMKAAEGKAKPTKWLAPRPN